MSTITLSKVGKVYDDGTRAVTGLDLEVEDGEFLVFVGPSGCGKTTALRMIAGLESITEGDLYIGDKLVNNVPPRDRDLAMVFQSYALYPHMSVRENIAFGLALRKVPKQQMKERVEQAARTLGLSEYLDRKPRNLSGGQRQRVAMGRAIVRQPAAFLMDEPLSNLDAKLRVQMRAEIGKLQHDLAVTTIYVTHDQTEAMTLGHRVAVVRKGELQQIAPPQELYDRPRNLFVAGFIGSPAMNFFSAEVLRPDDGAALAVQIGHTTLNLPSEVTSQRPALQRYVDKRLVVGVRPEDLEDAALMGSHVDGHALHGTVELLEPLGSDLMVHARVEAEAASGLADIAELAEDRGEALPAEGQGALVVARFNPRSTARIGEAATIAVATDRLHFFDPSSGEEVWGDETR
ncbi:MAG TPA: sn-glycerol-3-phosphate ABC transporter ATP-binding protein UgpC [Nocardioidaceae bacterium]|nr:sn-glycerol-3-phosphate ABC transporter ATP-binding protein UgpC [Nocardioidaceae bacterium]